MSLEMEPILAGVSYENDMLGLESLPARWQHGSASDRKETVKRCSAVGTLGSARLLITAMCGDRLCPHFTDATDWPNTVSS